MPPVHRFTYSSGVYTNKGSVVPWEEVGGRRQEHYSETALSEAHYSGGYLYICGMVWTHSHIITLMMGTQMVPETLVVFNELTQLIVQEDLRHESITSYINNTVYCYSISIIILLCYVIKYFIFLQF
jgi:hypothetical protein